MDKLPQEVFDHVCSMLWVSDINNFKHLSRRFWRASLNAGFRFGTAQLHAGKLDKFVELYRGFGQPQLSRAHFDIQWPVQLTRNDDDSSEEAHQAHLRDLGEEFAKQTTALFRALKVLEDDGLIRGTIQLEIETQDDSLVGSGRTRPDRPSPCLDFIRLVGPDELPVLETVRALEIVHLVSLLANKDSYYLHPRVSLDLLAKLPNLENLRAWMCDEHRCDLDSERRRIEAREEITMMLANTAAPAKLKRLMLTMQSLEAHKELDHSLAMPNLMGSATRDPFSTSMGIFCRNLTQLRIAAIIDGSFFWPEDDGSVLWPNMELLEVRFHVAAPSGGWYFEGPRGEGREVRHGYLVSVADASDPSREAGYSEEVQSPAAQHLCEASLWRIEPVDDVLYPFLRAYAKSAARMPRLKSAMIWSPMFFGPSDRDWDAVEASDYTWERMNERGIGWGIGYNAPGVDPDQGVDQLLGDDFGPVRDEARQFWLSLAWKELPADLIDLFHEIGRAEHGDELDHHEGRFGYQEDMWFSCFGPDDRPDEGHGYMLG